MCIYYPIMAVISTLLVVFMLCPIRNQVYKNQNIFPIPPAS